MEEGWKERVRTPRSRAELAGITLVAFAAFLLARHGTVPFRAGAVVVLVVVVGTLGWSRSRDRLAWESPSRVIERLAGRVDGVSARRAVRALALISGGVPAGTSPALAELHVARSVGALPRDRILGRAAGLGARYANAALFLVAAAIALLATRGFSVFEGADVLFSTGRDAPCPIRWIDGVEVDVRPPEYLHENGRELGSYGDLTLPRGTVLTFRGSPLHRGRRILLTDGKTDVAFEDDGGGRLVARWTLADSAILRVVARFGEVDIREPESTAVTSIDDDPPTVVLEGAPRAIRLADVGTKAIIPIKWVAGDDHGLREVHLVLRSGGREERRVLARLDGDTALNRGGHTLRTSDAFIKKSHAPIEIRVEAKDNDPVTGPKWGMSEAITVIPPEAGEPEALRLDSLRKLRDTFVDSLSARMERVFAVPPAARVGLAEADARSVDGDGHALAGVAQGSFAGVGLSSRVVALLRGQMRRVKEALTAEKRSPGLASHARLVTATERLVLVTDAVTRGQAQRDARSVARGLADVADDLVLASTEMQRTAERPRAEARADGSVIVLSGGASSLHRLGALGRDLGEIVDMDLARVARARAEEDLIHAEIAASDLAARLKDPAPSFGAQGSSGGRAGGESGGGGSVSGAGEIADDAERAFDEAAAELSKLSADHALEVSKVDKTVSEPDREREAEAPSEEAKAHARAVRDATKGLPSVGGGTDSWTNKGAAAREHAEAMARAVEDGHAGDAVTSGQSALDALDEAARVADRERLTGSFSAADQDTDRRAAAERLSTARGKLRPEVKWAEEMLQAERTRAAERKAPELSADGEEEQRLAARAGELRERGEAQQSLPETATRSLHAAETAAEEAASALKRGDLDRAQSAQREAQRNLESAREAIDGEPQDDHGRDGEDARSGHAAIPSVDAHKGPAEFRRRVIEGLGQPSSGRQRDAVRRYADGLLR